MALGERKDTWGQDKMLRAVVDTICSEIQQSKHQPPGRYSIPFIRVGERPQAAVKVSSVLLGSS